MLAEWDIKGNTLVNMYELKNCGKLKHAVMNQERIVTYDSQQQVIKVFDT